jgi:hypothetical protein
MPNENHGVWIDFKLTTKGNKEIQMMCASAKIGIFVRIMQKFKRIKSVYELATYVNNG